MSASPFHIRLPTYRRVPIDQIRLDPAFQFDAHFIKLIKKLEVGSLTVSHTRLQADLITSGFFRRDGDESIHVTNLRLEHLDGVQQRIRQGHRPSLGVYWSPLSPHESKLVCPDDEVWLAAYRSLGIGLVPVTIHDPGQVRRAEGAVWGRTQSGIASYFRALAPDIETLRTFFADEAPPFGQLIHQLVEACADTRTQIRAFHDDKGEALHYHQMLHALVLRHERALDTAGQLVEAGRSEHACAVVRMAYEAFLGFYVDWLSPAFFGPRLQLTSHLEGRRGVDLDAAEKKKDADTRRSLGSYDVFLTSIVDKARISPLGERFHSAIYPTLSWVTHQAYGVLEPEAMDFGTEVEGDAGLVTVLGQALDLVTAAMLSRIRDDVGALAPAEPATTAPPPGRGQTES